MCGRSVSNTPQEVRYINEVLDHFSMRFALSDPEPYTAMTETFPGSLITAFDSSEVVPVKWGLRKWDNKGIIINARSETYESSKFFGFGKSRMIVPVHGYYEWQKLSGNKKAKHLFTSNDKHGIFIAAVRKGSVLAVITKPAQDNIAHIHDRMPLFIPTNHVRDWLSGELLVDELSKVYTELNFRSVA